MSIRWGLSASDWRDHAIDHDGPDHPTGVLKARCGHLLKVVTPLRDTSCGTRCKTCTVAVAVVVARDDPSPP